LNKKYHLEHIRLLPGKKIYFASDFHLGAPNAEKSLVREKKICAWLEDIKADAQMVFLLGDLFDFWFEHKRVMPKGYTRFLGKLAELSDSGISIVIFMGNHDMWMKDYFSKEFGAIVHRLPQEYKFGDHRLQIGHGDGLGPGDRTYKLLKIFFESRICRFLFQRLIHPDFSLWLGYTWAGSSWKQHNKELPKRRPFDKERELLYHYCIQQEAEEHRDFYIFGHRHRVLDISLNDKSRYINLGDWIQFDSYAVYDGQTVVLKKYPEH
jgi:UDP-2,3-diacylglucosamine hydrolase